MGAPTLATYRNALELLAQAAAAHLGDEHMGALISASVDSSGRPHLHIDSARFTAIRGWLSNVRAERFQDDWFVRGTSNEVAILAIFDERPVWAPEVKS